MLFRETSNEILECVYIVILIARKTLDMLAKTDMLISRRSNQRNVKTRSNEATSSLLCILYAKISYRYFHIPPVFCTKNNDDKNFVFDRDNLGFFW